MKKFSIVGLLFATTIPSALLAEDFEIIKPTESSFEVTETEIRVELSQNGCAVGYEAACSKDFFQRSEYVSTHSHKHGDRVIYSWEMFVPEDFSYNAIGHFLRAVRFLDGAGQSIFNFHLNTEFGYTVGQNTCIGLEGFGEWHLVQVHANWDSTKKKNIKDRTPGEIRVECDGVEVLSRSGRPNIGVEEEVWLALGLIGSTPLADGDNTKVLFRNVSIEAQ